MAYIQAAPQAALCRHWRQERGCARGRPRPGHV